MQVEKINEVFKNAVVKCPSFNDVMQQQGSSPFTYELSLITQKRFLKSNERKIVKLLLKNRPDENTRFFVINQKFSKEHKTKPELDYQSFIIEETFMKEILKHTGDLIKYFNLLIAGFDKGDYHQEGLKITSGDVSLICTLDTYKKTMDDSTPIDKAIQINLSYESSDLELQYIFLHLPAKEFIEYISGDYINNMLI